MTSPAPCASLPVRPPRAAAASWRAAVAAVLALLLWLPASLRAQDLIVERAWLEDPSQRMTLAQVQQSPTQPYQGVLSRGYGESVLWLRLRIDPSAHPAPQRQPEQLVLRIRPVFLDDIQVFDALAPGGVAGVTGDHHHPLGQALQGQDFLLPIARGQAPRDIWLRLVSTSTRQVDVQALTADHWARRLPVEQLLFALYIGLVLVLATWGLSHWAFSRDPVVGAFGLAQALALAYALGSMGYLRAFWPAAWPAGLLDHFTSVVSVVSVSAAVLFHTLLVRELWPPRWLRRLNVMMVLLLPVKLALLGLGFVRQALELNMLEILVAPLAFLLTVLLARRRQAAGRQARPVLSHGVLAVFYLLLMALLGSAALPGLALAAGTAIQLYTVQAHGLFTGFLVLLMLRYRAHVLDQRQRDIALALERTQLQARQEREIREDQEKLMAMLAHELKTPLATMHMRLDDRSRGSSEIKRAMRDMRNVIERCLQATLLGDGRLLARPEPVDLQGLVHEAVSACSLPARVAIAAPEGLRLDTDRQLLLTVLGNLLENACKYAAPDTPILLEVKGDGRNAKGAGMATVTLRNQPGLAGWPDPDQVYVKYYRSPHARRQAGTGLGLFLAHRLMQTLGGSIRYAPDETWVAFELSLPLAPATATTPSPTA